MVNSVPYTKPSITELEVTYAEDAARNGWGQQCYDYVHKFETAFKRYIGTAYAISTSSCTGALHMGMAALDIGPGDEVILADTNWVATVSPVVHLGATPVFVDIDPVTWCLDPESVRSAITTHTRAIVVTHLYGNIADLDALQAIADMHGLALIEDAAEALGGSWRGRKAGSIGSFGAFSFHGTKTLTTGEGGMFVTDDADLYERVLTLSNHGRARGQTKQFFADVVGYKFKMSNIQAAIGCAQMERIDVLTSRKREILSRYQDFASQYAGVTTNPIHPDSVSGAWMPTYVFDTALNIRRDALIQTFKEDHIDARVFFYPLSSTASFTEHRNNRLAWDIPERAINLPSFHDMTNDDFQRIFASLKRILT